MTAIVTKKIEAYLKQNFKGKKIVNNRSLVKDACDIWGFNSLVVYVEERNNTIYYCY